MQLNAKNILKVALIALAVGVIDRKTGLTAKLGM